MCGRFAQYWPIERWGVLGPIEWHVGDFQPQYNVAPGSAVLSLVADHNRVWVGGIMHWGLRAGKHMVINARWETLAERPMFSRVLPGSRCLVPMNGYFEWHQESRLPYYFTATETDRPLLVAALYQRCPDGVRVCLVTRPAIYETRLIHPRMPLIVDHDQAHHWLSPDFDYEALHDAWSSQHTALQVSAVSSYVNSPRHNDAAVIQPLV